MGTSCILEQRPSTDPGETCLNRPALLLLECYRRACRKGRCSQARRPIRLGFGAATASPVLFVLNIGWDKEATAASGSGGKGEWRLPKARSVESGQQRAGKR